MDVKVQQGCSSGADFRWPRAGVPASSFMVGAVHLTSLWKPQTWTGCRSNNHQVNPGDVQPCDTTGTGRTRGPRRLISAGVGAGQVETTGVLQSVKSNGSLVLRAVGSNTLVFHELLDQADGDFCRAKSRES